ncbi:MAG TPA: hypothetical protein VLH85_08740 [Levilinea sp.]|nr:hypothetical protein [Levilinea sp.]
MIAPVTHILPLTRVRRARLLPENGRVLVRPGQKVNATDIVAESQQQSRHVLVDVRNGLRLNRKEPLDKYIDRRVGDRLQEGDVIGEAGGFFKHVVRSPVDGVVVAITGGRVLIEMPDTAFTLQAGITGVVSEVIPERGVIIEVTGALVQGIWGNGLIDMGVLLSLIRSPEDRITRDRLDVSMRGAVVLAGYCENADVFKAVADLPLRGLILSSIASDVLPAASKAPFPVIVLEGIGCIPMDSAAFKLLTTNEKRDVSINASAWDPFTGQRPELLVTLPVDGKQAPEVSAYKAGQTVRVQSPPYIGQIGVLTKVLPGRTRLSNGVRAYAGEIKLENNIQVILPLMNLDVLE